MVLGDSFCLGSWSLRVTWGQLNTFFGVPGPPYSGYSTASQKESGLAPPPPQKKKGRAPASWSPRAVPRAFRSWLPTVPAALASFPRPRSSEGSRCGGWVVMNYLLPPPPKNQKSWTIAKGRGPYTALLTLGYRSHAFVLGPVEVMV